MEAGWLFERPYQVVMELPCLMAMEGMRFSELLVGVVVCGMVMGAEMLFVIGAEMLFVIEVMVAPYVMVMEVLCEMVRGFEMLFVSEVMVGHYEKVMAVPYEMVMEAVKVILKQQW